MNESSFSDNSDTASEQSQDEPLISTRRCINEIIVDDSDEEIYDGYIIANIRDVSLDSITTLVNTSPSRTPSTKLTANNASANLDSLADLSPLGKRNLAKLTNLKTDEIEEPPAKRCQNCHEWMNWRTTGRLQKRKNGCYTYQGCCIGDCSKLFNDITNLQVNTPPPKISANIFNNILHQLPASVTHLLLMVKN